VNNRRVRGSKDRGAGDPRVGANPAVRPDGVTRLRARQLTSQAFEEIDGIVGRTPSLARWSGRPRRAGKCACSENTDHEGFVFSCLSFAPGLRADAGNDGTGLRRLDGSDAVAASAVGLRARPVPAHLDPIAAIHPPRADRFLGSPPERDRRRLSGRLGKRRCCRLMDSGRQTHPGCETLLVKPVHDGTGIPRSGRGQAPPAGYAASASCRCGMGLTRPPQRGTMRWGPQAHATTRQRATRAGVRQVRDKPLGCHCERSEAIFRSGD